MAEPAAEIDPALGRFLDGVRATLKGRLPALKQCELHGGRFDASELKRLSAAAPAIYLSVMAAPSQTLLFKEQGGEGRQRLTTQLTAFVVAKDAPGLPRDRAVLNLVEALLLMLPRNLWGLAGECGFPDKISAQNLYSGTLDRARVALWGVSWQQPVFLGQAMESEWVIPTELYSGIEPETGTVHKDDYERLL
ncbi:hypothetical protein [Candidatus Sororendozoicomonas aggregata]|uniref:hypothetical protein n=1 Tax=Candidatus Sororendozoicomonas aggregata TaxID=3073239 RepID=UPI002ED1F9DB